MNPSGFYVDPFFFVEVFFGITKSPSNCMFNGLLFHFGLKIVGLPRNKLASYFILIFNILRNQE